MRRDRTAISTRRCSVRAYATLTAATPVCLPPAPFQCIRQTVTRSSSGRTGTAHRHGARVLGWSGMPQGNTTPGSDGLPVARRSCGVTEFYGWAVRAAALHAQTCFIQTGLGPHNCCDSIESETNLLRDSGRATATPATSKCSTRQQCGSGRRRLQNASRPTALTACCSTRRRSTLISTKPVSNLTQNELPDSSHLDSSDQKQNQAKSGVDPCRLARLEAHHASNQSANVAESLFELTHVAALVRTQRRMRSRLLSVRSRRRSTARCQAIWSPGLRTSEPTSTTPR
jgi:hypothetical protein